MSIQTQHTSRLLFKEVSAHRTPGAIYIHFNRSGITEQHCAGMANVAAGTPVNTHLTASVFSITKIATAIAILQLEQAGRLFIHEPISDYLPELMLPGDITIHHLLTHTSGLGNPLPLNWTHLPQNHANFDSRRFFCPIIQKAMRRRHPPGKQFLYSNLGYILLGFLIERVTGKRYEEVVEQKVLAGLANTSFTAPHANNITGYHRHCSLSSALLSLLIDKNKMMGAHTGIWQPFVPHYLNGAAYGGLFTSAADLATLGRNILNGVLLSDTATNKMFTENRTISGAATGMCLGWFTGRLNGHTYFHHAGGGGGYYAEFRLYPAAGCGSVLFYNRSGFTDQRELDRCDQYHLPSS
ncbi:MAG: beta-lactamase family protein [Flavipsychrobacter sp.]|nr:beta-lactamase family protein [Flavipsychrobacter sp.]